MSDPGAAYDSRNSSPARMTPRRLASHLLWLLGGLSFAASSYLAWNFVYDDAYISFRYAHNLVEHGELVWNLGEPVEGYTNFLHVLGISGLMAVGIPPVIAARLINTVAFLALVVLYCRIAIRVAPGEENAVARAVGGLFLLGSASLSLWLLGGLEIVMVAALELAAICCVLPMFEGRALTARSVGLSGLFFGLAYLTRPDAVVVAGAVLLGGLLFAPLSLGRRLRDVVQIGAIMSIVVVAHVLWRLYYYHELWPNTYHAKLGIELTSRLSFGASYVLASIPRIPVVPVALVLFATMKRARSTHSMMNMLATCLVAHTCYVVWAGGDHLPAFRFFVSLLAPAALLVAASLANRRFAYTIAAAVFGIANAVMSPLVLGHRYHSGAEGGTIVGRYIATSWPEGSLVALNVAGATPFYAPRHRFVDMLGLNDAVISRRNPVPLRTAWQRRPGHAKGDGAYVLRRQPDFIIIGGGFGADAKKGWFLSDIEIAESPEFHECYRREVHHFDAEDPLLQESAANWPDLEFIYYRRTCAQPSHD